MSDQGNIYKLKEILAHTDAELTGNWSRLASLIKNYEKMAWRDAQKLASQLIKDSKALAYVSEVRKKTSSKKKKSTTKKKANTSKKKENKVIPINKKRDRFSMNYRRLLRIAPDLIERLENGEEVYGKSIKTGYDDFSLELIHTDKTGYYLAIAHHYKQNGDMVPDPDMRILVNVELETVQALSFQNTRYYREVYDDIFDRKAVYMAEKQAQNAFLQDWLNNLFKQDQEIQWLHDKESSGKSADKKKTSESKEEVDLPKRFVVSSAFFKATYEKLLKLIPDLDKKLKKYGSNLQAISSKKKLSCDLILKVEDEFDLAYNLMLSESVYFDTREYKSMELRIDLKTKEVKAILTYLPHGEIIRVYEDLKNLEGVHQEEIHKQNISLSKWLDKLIEKGHKLQLINEKEESGKSEDENQNEKPDISYMNDKAIVRQKEYADSDTLDEAITKYTLYDNGELKLRPIALYFLVDRLNNSPLSIKKLAYPGAKELKEDYEKIVGFQGQQDKADSLTGMKKPDISFVPEKLDKSIRELIENTSIKQAELAYSMHEKGEQKLDALSLFYIVEKLNENDKLASLVYPKESEIKAYVQSLNPKGHNKVISELKKEIELTEKLLFGPLTYKANYGKLLKVAPNLLEKLPKNGELIGGTSKESTNDLTLLIEDAYNDGFVISLLESKGEESNFVFGHTVKVFFNPKSQELKALSTYGGSADSIAVYGNPKTFEQVDKEQEKKQNTELGEWLDELYNQGHRIKKLELIEPETGEGEPVKKPDQKVSRLEKAKHNQILKTNYQKLMRLVPNLFELEIRTIEMLKSKKGESFYIMASDMKGDFAHVFELTTYKPRETWTIHVQRTTQKVFVKSFHEIAYEKVELSAEIRNERFGKWLSEKIKEGYKFPVNETQELLKKFPIVLEWTEGANDENVGFNSLEKLRTRLKNYVITGIPTKGYIKNKVWFKGYPNYIRIDLSIHKGDYNPHAQNLLDWLKQSDSNFDWTQFSKPRKKKKDKSGPVKSRKELQKEVENEIPDFEPGKVQLMPAHKKAGLMQKHIDWINKHKQGMTITPIRRMVNKTKNFWSDFYRKAKKPGFRISWTGKLYYETRSNRSDLTTEGH